ncbi:MAG: NAD(P)H-hydrate dehydratase [Desulfovibrio sp.]|jgi:NAD(P)H-hydrate epimerase|nr:NAD(P)H-hydrate dehydratase [Desulfovibrio sp.]
MRAPDDFSDNNFPALSQLPLPAEMHAWDAAAVNLGLPEVLLMENAGRAAFSVLCRHVSEISGKDVWLFMGSGNNGGDAASLARALLEANARPLVLHIRPLNTYKGVAAKHIRMAKAAGVPFVPLKRHPLENPPEILVDGLLGTGFSGVLRPELQKNIENINHITSFSPRFVLALDIPSGLDAATGLPAPVAVRASATVSFAAAKPGLLLPWARQWTGRVHVRPIGIPARIRASLPCSAYLLDGRMIPPAVPQNSYKNSYGHVLVLGGAQGYSGAAHLAARAALRAGAGLVTALAPAANVSEIKNNCPEIMTCALRSSNTGQWPEKIPPELHELGKRCTAFVAGPGLGRGDDAARFLTSLMSLKRPPTVFDADALMLFANYPTLLQRINDTDILTPHPGEAAALLLCDTKTVQADRESALKKLCGLCAGVILLKGAGTLVGQKGKPLLISPYDVPQLAVGGSGDVLSGCLGALLAQAGSTQSSLYLAGTGVVLHALAGRRCALMWPERGNTACDIADALPLTRADLTRQKPDRELLPWPE